MREITQIWHLSADTAVFVILNTRRGRPACLPVSLVRTAGKREEQAPPLRYKYTGGTDLRVCPYRLLCHPERSEGSVLFVSNVNLKIPQTVRHRLRIQILHFVQNDMSVRNPAYLRYIGAHCRHALSSLVPNIIIKNLSARCAMLLEYINSALSGYILPAILLIAGLYLGWRLRFFYILHPVRLCRDIRDSAASGGVSPFRALSVALAGTLGVGNITGVATAIACGGAGAVFWMWVCAFLVMSVKYAEVYLAQVYRTPEGTGGAMYYMRDGLRNILGKGAAAVAAGFAVLIAANSLLTGSIVQVDAAAGVVSELFTGVPPILCGIAFAILAAITAAGGLRRVSDLTVRLIPALSAVYIVVSAVCIIRSADALPDAFREIFDGAFSPAAAGGGVLGFGINAAVRYGVTRGIFSNEAGCGTAPSAHAAANAKSPHHQGCMGIFEVFADTVVLCTVTALVILTSGITPSEDGMISALAAFSISGGHASAAIIGISVVLFAFATVICQSYYGLGAVRYLTGSDRGRRLYIAMLAVSAVIGSVISANVMWGIADLIIAVMTVVNTMGVIIICKGNFF